MKDKELHPVSPILGLSLLGRNALIYSIGNITLRLGSLFLIPIYTYSLTVGDFGLLAGIFVMIQIMITLMDLKGKESVVRFFAAARADQRVGPLICNSLLLNLVGGIVVSFLAIFCLSDLIAGALKTERVADSIPLACGVALAQSLCMNVLSYYRAQNDGRRFMLASVVAFLLVFFLTAACLILLQLGIWGALVAQLISYSTVTLFICFDIFSQELSGFSWTKITEMIRYGGPLVLGNLGDHCITASGIFFLGYLTNLETVAIYSLGQRIAKIVGVGLTIPFQMAFEPFVFANLGKPEIRATIGSLLTYLMFISTFVSFGVAVFAKDIIQIIAPEAYSQAYLVVLLILPATAFRGVYYVGESLLHIRKKTLFSGGIVAALGGCSLLVNYVLISWIGLYGAVLAFDLVVVCIGLSTLALGMKVFPVPLEMQRLLALAALLIVLLGAVFIVDGFDGYAYYPLLATLGVLSLLGLYLADFFNKREMYAARGVWRALKTSLA